MEEEPYCDFLMVTMRRRSLPNSLEIQKKSMKQKRKKKGFMKKLMDYLLSDTYMYAPLLSSTPSESEAEKVNRSPSTGHLSHPRGASTGPISNKRTGKEHPREEPPAICYENEHQRADGYIESPVPVARPETVKHMVHYSTRILSSPEVRETRKTNLSKKRKPILNDFVTTRSKQSLPTDT